MEVLLGLSLTFVFSVLAAIHFYWAAGGQSGWYAVVPDVEGEPAAVPSRFATLTIALVLATTAAVVAASAGLVRVPVPEHMLRSLAFGLAFVVAMRGVGDFDSFGIFKTTRDTYFAEMDSLVYSPLCLVLAIGAVVMSLPRPGF